MIKTLENWDVRTVEQNYELARSLQQSNDKWDGVKIAFACMRAEFAKGLYDTASFSSWLFNVIRLKGAGVSNAREIGISFSEHKRNIEGMIASPFVSKDYAIGKYLTQGPNEANLKPEEQKELGMLYAVTEAVDYVFRKFKLHYTACSGTALGAERSESFILGDDDVDSAFDSRILSKMQFLFDEGIFSEMTGLHVHNQKDQTDGWQVSHPEARKPQGKNKVAADFFMDVMPVMEQDGKMVFTNNTMRNRFLNDYMTVEEFNDTQRKPFGPIEINLPKKVRDYITRAYHEQALRISYSFPTHSAMGGAISSFSPSRIWNVVSGIFEYRRRIAVKTPTRYDEQVYQAARTKIIERIKAFRDRLGNDLELQQKFKDHQIPIDTFLRGTCNTFIDGVYDLFHQGHGKSFEKAVDIAKKVAYADDVRLIVGVCGDKACESYKRLPIMNEEERERVVANYRRAGEDRPLVHEVIHHSPTDGPTREFLTERQIDLVLHGDDFSEDDCKKYYGHALAMKIFRLYPYEPGVSTTMLLKAARNKENPKFPDSYVNLTGITSEELIARIQARG